MNMKDLYKMLFGRSEQPQPEKKPEPEVDPIAELDDAGTAPGHLFSYDKIDGQAYLIGDWEEVRAATGWPSRPLLNIHSCDIAGVLVITHSKEFATRAHKWGKQIAIPLRFRNAPTKDVRRKVPLICSFVRDSVVVDMEAVE